MIRHTPRQYAAAFVAALKGKKRDEQREMIRRLLSLVSKRGDSPRLGLILNEIEKKYFKDAGVKKVDVESASPLSAAVKKEIEAALGGDIFLREKITPGLLAGMKLLVDDETLIDASAEAQLKKLFP